MISHIWKELENKHISVQNDLENITQQYAVNDKKELHLDYFQSWFDNDEAVLCSYERRGFFVETVKGSTRFKDKINNENLKNKKAFEDFIQVHLDDIKVKNRFVAFVNGEFQDSDDIKNVLIKKMYDRFGNIDMYVEKISDYEKTILIDTPEFN